MKKNKREAKNNNANVFNFEDVGEFFQEIETTGLFNPAEVAELLECSNFQSCKIIRKLNDELKEKGFIVFKGKVPRLYLLERFGLLEFEKEKAPQAIEKPIFYGIEAVTYNLDCGRVKGYNVLKDLNERQREKGFLTFDGYIHSKAFHNFFNGKINTKKGLNV